MTCGLATALEPPHFNPRTRVGCDIICTRKTKLRNSFNPRTRVGCDVERFGMHRTYSRSFNPRTRVGCDTFNDVTLSPITCFNPRTRVGCDTRWGCATPN